MKQRWLVQHNDDSANPIPWAGTSPTANTLPPQALPLTSASAADNSRSNPWKP